MISSRAQACVAVTAGEALYIVDAGTGSNATMALAGESLQRLQGILLTHFHSDHIAGLADFNLTSWVVGRDAPLQVMGPPGVERVVAGFNEAFSLDRQARVLLDIQDYHAATADLSALAESASVRLLALYHLVPAPQNYLMERIFERDVPDDAVITTDGMVFELPRNDDAIHVMVP